MQTEINHAGVKNQPLKTKLVHKTLERTTRADRRHARAPSAALPRV
jgi:hypothetical protein